MTGTKNAVAWFGSRVVNGPRENERKSSRSTSYPLLKAGVHESAEYRSCSKSDGRNVYTLNVSSNDASPRKAHANSSTVSCPLETYPNAHSRPSSLLRIASQTSLPRTRQPQKSIAVPRTPRSMSLRHAPLATRFGARGDFIRRSLTL